MGERFMRVAPRSSSRSLFALGSVSSWGSTSSTLPGSIPSSPSTPTVTDPSVSVIR